MKELKPCPFCGGEHIELRFLPQRVDLVTNPQVYRGTCKRCHAIGPLKHDWNTRPSPWRSLKDEPPKAVCDGTQYLFRAHDDCEKPFVVVALMSPVGWFVTSGDEKFELDEHFTEWMEIPS